MARWFPVRVAGDSMLPTLRAGDFLVARAPRSGEPAPGQIVVALGGTVKRVKEVRADGLWLEGDNAAVSLDSRSTGAVPPQFVEGVVRARYWPVWRARRFR